MGLMRWLQTFTLSPEPLPKPRVEEVLRSLQTITLRPGDILAVMVPHPMTPEGRKRFGEELRATFPQEVNGARVIVLEGGTTLARVTYEQGPQ